MDRQKQFENATCGRGFFRKRMKKRPFSKISGYVWTGPDSITFTKGKSSFSFIDNFNSERSIAVCSIRSARSGRHI